MAGMPRIHHTHHEPQKSSTTYFPRKEESFRGLPCRSGSSKSGASPSSVVSVVVVSVVCATSTVLGLFAQAATSDIVTMSSIIVKHVFFIFLIFLCYY